MIYGDMDGTLIQQNMEVLVYKERKNAKRIERVRDCQPNKDNKISYGNACLLTAIGGLHKNILRKLRRITIMKIKIYMSPKG